MLIKDLGLLLSIKTTHKSQMDIHYVSLSLPNAPVHLSGQKISVSWWCTHVLCKQGMGVRGGVSSVEILSNCTKSGILQLVPKNYCYPTLGNGLNVGSYGMTYIGHLFWTWKWLKGGMNGDPWTYTDVNYCCKWQDVIYDLSVNTLSSMYTWHLVQFFLYQQPRGHVRNTQPWIPSPWKKVAVWSVILKQSSVVHKTE